MNISISRDGVEIGEWPEEQLRSLYKEGQLVATDRYWKEGMDEWKELGTFIKPPPPRPIAKNIDSTTPLQLSQSTIVTPQSVSKHDWILDTLFILIALVICASIFCYFGKDLSYLGYWGAIGGLIAGLLLGLIPFFIARNYNKVRRPDAYLWIVALAGTVGGLLVAIPITLLMIIFLCVRQATRPKVNATARKSDNRQDKKVVSDTVRDCAITLLIIIVMIVVLVVLVRL